MWEITEKEILRETGVTTTGYGITRGGTTIADISVNKEEVEKLIEQLNRLDVSEAHAYDIVEDFLAG